MLTLKKITLANFAQKRYDLLLLDIVTILINTNKKYFLFQM